MNTIAWMVDGNEETYVLALHGDVALLVKGERPTEVWQFRGYGQQAAIDRLVHETANIERQAGDVRDPVEFDLSPEAEWQIWRSTTFMGWFEAPALREELMAAVDDPGMHLTWSPTSADWVTVGYVEDGVSFTSSPPSDPALGDIWIER